MFDHGLGYECFSDLSSRKRFGPYMAVSGDWPFTPKIDRATWAFLRLDMRHGVE